MTIILHLRR